MKLGDLPTPALVVDGADARRQPRDDGRGPPGRAVPAPREGAQDDGARPPPGRGRATRASPPRRHARSSGWPRPGSATDLLLANETVDPDRLRAMADCDARVTVAVDSDATVDAAAAAGIREVLVDVTSGCPAAVAHPADAGRIADRARAARHRRCAA